MKNLKFISFILFGLILMISCQKEVSQDLRMIIPDVINLIDHDIITLDQQLNDLTNDAKFEVYNRWGVLIHESNSAQDIFQQFHSNLSEKERNNRLVFRLSYELKSTGKTIGKTGRIE